MANVYSNHFPLGLGCKGFPVHDMNDEFGIQDSVRLVLHALEHGVTYADICYMYCNNRANEIFRRVKNATKIPFSVTVKSMASIDKAPRQLRSRVETSLRALDIDCADYFLHWAIKTTAEVDYIRREGLYETALLLKKEGKIKHICASVHLPPAETVAIIEKGFFEGLTISYSVLNAAEMLPVLDSALRHNVGLAVMNPLGGGLIPNNQDLFSFLCNDNEKNVVQSALRFVASHPAVNVVLSGVSNIAEFDENLGAFTKNNTEKGKARYLRVVGSAGKSLNGFCTGCGYCVSCGRCPAKINIPAFMQAYNKRLFVSPPDYCRTEPLRLLKDIDMMKTLCYVCGVTPINSENPCVKCGRCESICTQRLKIKESIAQMYEVIKRTGVSTADRKRRLTRILGKAKTIGLYPSGVNSAALLAPEYGLEETADSIFVFDGSPMLKGTVSNGYVVHSPDEISTLAPDVVIITSYRHQESIYKTIKKYESEKTRIVKLCADNEMPFTW